MLNVFVVTLGPDVDPATLLSEETLNETQAQLMTPEEAGAMGFPALPSPPEGHTLALIAVAKRDARWIQRALEAHHGVTSYKVAEL